MTVIAGLVQDGEVYLAGDSALSSDGQIVVAKRGKIFRCGELLLGNSGSVRIPQLMEQSFELPPVTEPLERYLVVDFVAALKKLLKDDEQKADDLLQGSAFLIGVRGRLFILCSDFQISEPDAGYDAIGAAEDVALGSLHTTQSLCLSAHQRLALALEAAYAHNGTIRQPFTFLSSECEEG